MSNQQEEDYYIRFVGKPVDVLIEKIGKNYSIGHTSNYIPVKIKEYVEPNKIYKVKIVEVCKLDVYGKLIN